MRLGALLPSFNVELYEKQCCNRGSLFFAYTRQLKMERFPSATLRCRHIHGIMLFESRPRMHVGL